jgi:hypothetical protein
VGDIAFSTREKIINAQDFVTLIQQAITKM